MQPTVVAQQDNKDNREITNIQTHEVFTSCTTAVRVYFSSLVPLWHLSSPWICLVGKQVKADAGMKNKG
jgi:hypothetical protein